MDVRVIAATNGEEGLETFCSLRPELVITTLCPLQMTSVSLIERIKTIDEDIPILIVSSNPSLESAKTAIRLNVFDFIIEPVEHTHLKQILERAQNKMKNVHAHRAEVKALREELVSVKGHLYAERRTMNEVRSLAMVARLFAETLRNADSTIDYIVRRTRNLQTLRTLTINPERKEQAYYLDRILKAVMTYSERSNATNDDDRDPPLLLPKE